MPTDGAGIWFCDHIADGPWPFLLLGLPLVGAYFYGKSRQKLAWILIGSWIAFQVPMLFFKTIVYQCDATPEVSGEGGLPSASAPGEVAPEPAPEPPAPEKK